MSSLIPPDGTNPWSASFKTLWNVAHNDDGTEISSAAVPVVSTSAPSSPHDGELWWDPDDASQGTAAVIPFVFSRVGPVTVSSGVGRWPLATDYQIVAVVAAVGTDPTGANLIIDVNLNGTTMFTTQANRPTIVAGSQQSAITVPDVTALAPGDLLSMDIDQIGSSVAGSDLTVVVYVQ